MRHSAQIGAILVAAAAQGAGCAPSPDWSGGFGEAYVEMATGPWEVEGTTDVWGEVITEAGSMRLDLRAAAQHQLSHQLGVGLLTGKLQLPLDDLQEGTVVRDGSLAVCATTDEMNWTAERWVATPRLEVLEVNQHDLLLEVAGIVANTGQRVLLQLRVPVPPENGGARE